MRFDSKRPYVGQKRVVRRFAWLPKRVNDNTVIWLESYWSHQEYCFSWGDSSWDEMHITLIN